MSLVGFSARNHPQQAVRDAVDDRGTTPAMFAPLNAEFAFTLDAAASIDNAKCAKFFTRETDGLLRSWAGSPNLKECLHLDDVLKALPTEVPDSSAS